MKTLAFVFTFARKYSLQLALTIISMLLLVGAQLLVPWVIRDLINTVTGDNLTQDVLDTIGVLTLVVLGVFILRAGLQFMRSYMAHVAGWGVVADLRKYVLRPPAAADPALSTRINRPGR